MPKSWEKFWEKVNQSNVKAIQEMYTKYGLTFVCNDGKVVGAVYESRVIETRQSAS